MAKSTRQIGIDFQLKCWKYLKNLHPTAAVHNFKPTARKVGGHWISQDNDLWNCIDIAFMGTYGFKFIQCTTGTNVGRKLADMVKVYWSIIKAYEVELWIERPNGNIARKELCWKIKDNGGREYYFQDSLMIEALVFKHGWKAYEKKERERKKKEEAK